MKRLLRQEFNEPEIEEIWSVVKRLPVIQVKIDIAGKNLPLVPSKQEYVQVKQNSEVTVTVTMKRKNRLGKEGLKCHCPKFPKPKDEAWLLIIGDASTKELLALKRVGGVRGKKR